MLRLIQVIIGLIVLAIDAIAIGYFCDWLSKTDWLMGHTHGPASSLIVAMWTASAGILGTAIWIAIALFRRIRYSAEKHKKSSVWLVLQGVVLVLLLVPTGFIVATVVPQLTHVRAEVRTQRFRAGHASVAELAAGLKAPEFPTRFWAMEELKKLGPQATPAVPELAATLQDPTLAPEAAQALAVIGPAAQPAIPELVATIMREQGKDHDGRPTILSWQAGRALTHIGPAAIPELLQLLSHKDRYVRLTATSALGNFGPQANDAVPALTQALSDDDELIRQWARVALDRIQNRRPVDAF